MSQKEVNERLKLTRDSLDQLENIVNSTIDQINSQNNLMPIQPIKSLYLDKCRVRDCENHSFYGSHYIRLDVPKECVRILNEKHSDIKGDEVWEYYRFNYNSEESKKNFMTIINSIEELDSKTDEENIKASQTNIHTKDVVMKMLKDIGVPTQKYEYKTSRSRKKDWITCAWTYEIQSAFKTYSSNLTTTKNKLIETFEKLYQVDQDKRKKEQEERQKEVERKENERLLAFMLSKYELDITADWEDLQRTIISKDKYLYLAHYLRKNRGDWNEGYSYAGIGLSNFTIENQQDQEIFDCINGLITEIDYVDGRCFRDCEWNYDVLFGIVREQNLSLYEDYQKTVENIDDY